MAAAVRRRYKQRMVTEQQLIHELNKMRVELEDYYDACALMNLDKHDNLAGSIQEMQLQLARYQMILDYKHIDLRRHVIDDGK